MMIAINDGHISATIEALASGEGAMKELRLTAPPIFHPYLDKWCAQLAELRKTLEDEVRRRS